MKLYTVYDRVAGVHSAPFHSVNNATAQREFAYACNMPNTAYNTHPADYQLFYSCDFNEKDGSFSLLPKEVYICSGSDCVKEVSNEV